MVSFVMSPLWSQRMTERKQCENLSVRHEGRAFRITKAHKRKARKGEGKGA